MKLISLSGPCGSGKSTLIKALEPSFDFLNSTYKKSKGALMDPMSYESKEDYLETWFDEVYLSHRKGRSLAFSDRCPFDSLAYLEERQLEFKDELYVNFSNLQRNGIKHFPILITAKVDILRERIQKRYDTGNRLELDFERELQLLEKSIVFFEKNISFYTLVIDTSNENPIQSYRKLESYAKKILMDNIQHNKKYL